MRLIEELPEHLAAMVVFSVLTGLRQRNVRELRWSQVDLERRAIGVPPHEAKGRRGISVPLTVEAAKIVDAQRGRHAEFVFTFRGKPVRSVNNTAWRTALKRAGIAGFRWHDLRHTWATWHAQAGTLLHVLAGARGLGVGGNGEALRALHGRTSGFARRPVRERGSVNDRSLRFSYAEGGYKLRTFVTC